jgi:hypothetical protein
MSADLIRCQNCGRTNRLPAAAQGTPRWDEEPVLDLRAEDGDADAVGGEHVAVGVGKPTDEAVETQPPQVVNHLP